MTRHFALRLPVAVLAAAFLAAGPAFGAEEAPLKIGARSTGTSPKAILEKYQPLAEYLSKKLGRPVTLRPSGSNPEVLGKLKSGEIDAAILGSAGGARAVRDLGANPVARPEKGGVSGYRGFIIVRKDSGYRKIEDLKGKRFDCVEKGTSVGYLYPRAVLAGKKIDPDAFFGETVFAGKHAMAITKVLYGGAEGASVKDTDFLSMAGSDPRVDAGIRVIQKSTFFPEGTILLGKDASSATVKAVSQALLGMDKDPEGKAALAAVGADRYVATGKKDFTELQHMMALLKE
jgi:phosphonate transport system substrate-binding protein